MKKFYLLGGMAVATALFAAATAFPTTFPGQTGEAIYADAAPQADGVGLPTPYYSLAAVSSSQLANGWDVINANNDAKTWSATSDYSSPFGFCANSGYTSSTGLPQDDYLLAPAVHLEAGKAYKICYTWKAGGFSDVENFAVYVSTSKEPEEIKASTKISEYLAIKQTSYTKEIVDFTPTYDGDYYVAFYCFSERFKTGVKIADLLIAEDKFAPSGVTGLTATPGLNRELSCKLTWTLPTTDTFGADIPEDKPITAVKIYRDGEEIENTNLDGTATSFTDNADFGLTSGYHTYGVSVIADGVEGARTQVGPTAYVGPIEPFAVPATFSCGTLSDLELWTIQKGEAADDGKNWSYYSYGKYAEYSIQYGKTDDAWLITPPVNVEAPGYYRLSVEICKANINFEPVITLEMGSSTEISDMQTLGQIVVAQNNSSSISEWPTVYRDIKIDAAGVYYFAIHNNTLNAPGGNTLKVHSLMVEQVALCPEVVTGLVATPAEDGSLNINVSWINPTNSTIGEVLLDDDYQLEIYLNDAETPAVTVDGGNTQIVVPVEVADVYTVTVKAVGKVGGASAPVPASVKTTWVGPRVVAVPYYTEFADEDGTRSIWEIHDLNEDGHSFTIGKYSYSPYYCYMLLTGATENKDYLVSPVFNLESGLYKITVSHSSGSNSSEVNPVVGLIKNNTFNAEDVVSSFIASKTFTGLKNYSAEEASFTFMITEAGEYQAVYGDEESGLSSSAKVDLRSFSIAAEATFPADVTDLTATVSVEKENTVELTWVNPSKIYDTEYDLPSIESVVIERDGEIIATLTEGMTLGEPTAYTDEEVTNGVHTYTVYVTFAGNAHPGDYPSVTSDWVGGGLSVPYDETNPENGGIHQVGVFTGWKTVDEDGTYLTKDDDIYSENRNKWYYNSSYNVANSSWGIEPDSNDSSIAHTNDDYLISCPVKFEKNIIYQITYNYSLPDFKPESNWDIIVKMGTGDSHTEYAEVSRIPFDSSWNRWGVFEHSFNVAVGVPLQEESIENGIMLVADEPANPRPVDLYEASAKIEEGDNRVALHANSKSGAVIRQFHVKQIAYYDPTTEIVEVGAGKVTFDGQDVNFGGVAAVQVYNLAGVCVANTTAEGSFNVSKLGAGYYVVKVTTDSETVTLKVTVK